MKLRMTVRTKVTVCQNIYPQTRSAPSLEGSEGSFEPPRILILLVKMCEIEPPNFPPSNIELPLVNS